MFRLAASLLLLLPTLAHGLRLPSAAHTAATTAGHRRHFDVALLDVSPSVAKQFQNNVEGAILVDRVVQAAQAELRDNKLAVEELGDPINIETCIGASVKADGVVMVRYFQIFSTSGGPNSQQHRIQKGKSIQCRLVNTVLFPPVKR